ncbi:hypothetical protein KIPB_007929, partial [Kipferlia bialata]|eukprot:g7929.t1
MSAPDQNGAVLMGSPAHRALFAVAQHMIRMQALFKSEEGEDCAKAKRICQNIVSRCMKPAMGVLNAGVQSPRRAEAKRPIQTPAPDMPVQEVPHTEGEDEMEEFDPDRTISDFGTPEDVSEMSPFDVRSSPTAAGGDLSPTVHRHTIQDDVQEHHKVSVSEAVSPADEERESMEQTPKEEPSAVHGERSRESIPVRRSRLGAHIAMGEGEESEEEEEESTPAGVEGVEGEREEERKPESEAVTPSVTEETEAVPEAEAEVEAERETDSIEDAMALSRAALDSEGESSDSGAEESDDALMESAVGEEMEEQAEAEAEVEREAERETEEKEQPVHILSPGPVAVESAESPLAVPEVSPVVVPQREEPEAEVEMEVEAALAEDGEMEPALAEGGLMPTEGDMVISSVMDMAQSFIEEDAEAEGEAEGEAESLPTTLESSPFVGADKEAEAEKEKERERQVEMEAILSSEQTEVTEPQVEREAPDFFTPVAQIPVGLSPGIVSMVTSTAARSISPPRAEEERRVSSPMMRSRSRIAREASSAALDRTGLDMSPALTAQAFSKMQAAELERTTDKLKEAVAENN